MSFSFNAPLSGLNASSNALNVVGNNIANASTIGFRSSSITFSDIFANSSGARLNGAGNAIAIGDGVQTAAIHTNYSQGNLGESGSPLHVGLQGDGFFVVRSTDGSMGYTRAGDFTVNNQGFLVASNGGSVMGYGATNGSSVDYAQLVPLQIPLGRTLPPQATSQATFRVNLNSDAEVGSTYHANMTVFDSLGTERPLDLSFVRQADGTFQMTVSLDGVPAQTSVDGGAASAAPVVFSFDSNGIPISPTSLSIVPDQTQLGNAALPPFELRLREVNPDGTLGDFNFTSYAKPSTHKVISQDGYAAGELENAAVDQNGNIFGIFSNGQSRIVGQYSVATFNSNEGLSRQGGSMFSETTGSGQPTIGTAGTGGRGFIAGGYVEQSNVNITNEFVDLIQAQRGFQANSRVITTLNQTFQDLLQIL
jgi:flagellar hook protein FlgE